MASWVAAPEDCPVDLAPIIGRSHSICHLTSIELTAAPQCPQAGRVFRPVEKAGNLLTGVSPVREGLEVKARPTPARALPWLARPPAVATPGWSACREPGSAVPSALPTPHFAGSCGAICRQGCWGVLGWAPSSAAAVDAAEACWLSTETCAGTLPTWKATRLFWARPSALSLLNAGWDLP